MRSLSLLLPALASLFVATACTSGAAEMDEEETVPSESALTASTDAEDATALADIKAKAIADITKKSVSLKKNRSSLLMVPKSSPSSGARTTEFSLYGVDWFQQWDGGLNADHNDAAGTDQGKLCMWAAVYRFEAIMADPPQELKDVKAVSTWGGSFYNWVDDFSQATDSRPSGAKAWAWASGLSKWISQVSKAGTCYLPTKELLIDYAADCKRQATETPRDIKECSAGY